MDIEMEAMIAALRQSWNAMDIAEGAVIHMLDLLYVHAGDSEETDVMARQTINLLQMAKGKAEPFIEDDIE